MDSGDYIYIIIAIVLAIVNAVANKKKKAAKMAGQSQPTAKPTTNSDPTTILQDILMGKNLNSQEDKPTVVHDEWDAQKDINPSTEKYNEPEFHPQSSFEYEKKEEIKSIEYDIPVQTVTEEKLYPIVEPTPIDIPENANFSPIDNLSSIEGNNIIDYDYNAPLVSESNEEKKPDLIFDHEKAMAFEESKSTVADDFDPVKAIIYSEIMTPKYI